MSSSPDIVVLTIPRGAHALPVMRVLMGGVACQHEIPLDRLDDLQLAVETVLAEEPRHGGELRLEIWVEGGRFVIRLSGLTSRSVREALGPRGGYDTRGGCALDVRLFLTNLVDAYRVVGDNPGCYAVEMEKRAS